MTNIRTVAMAAVLAMGMAGIAGAQDQMRREGPGRGMRHRGAQHGHMMKDLNLSDAQKARIKAIQEKYRPQMEALADQNRNQFRTLRNARQKGDTSAAARARAQQQREQFRQRVTTLRGQQLAEVRTVLTTEQQAKWDARSKERRSRMEGRRGGMKERRGQRRSS